MADAASYRKLGFGHIFRDAEVFGGQLGGKERRNSICTLSLHGLGATRGSVWPGVVVKGNQGAGAHCGGPMPARGMAGSHGVALTPGVISLGCVSGRVSGPGSGG